ncbi:XrtY-associated glycosyltransferase XYAG1 [Mucilaginibacter lappiensis]|uniref:Glycosyltransferase involved in cell wall biosynthesis n=1 Tax=Mucilaginibacter lappiensis TaxID=354630 RepID=A0A841JHW2_9SPHI|nr:glycosyltransferase [Mucilaginibacter lappiensis]MBB6128035.1 glycosyltransferase involved in cell wall biosynthesis [Mucilaginibacter lappiensis]
MKILQISASYKPAFIYGGPIMSVSMLCEQLTKAGCEIMVYTTTANGSSELTVTPNQPVNMDGVPVIYFKRITKDHTHFSPALLKSVWQNVKKYDVVHIQAWWNLVSVLSCLIAVWRKVPVVVSARGTLSPYSFQNKNGMIKSLIHRLLTRPLLKRCHIHTTSAYEQSAVDSIIKYKSIATIYNFVKLPVYYSQEQSAISSPIKLIFLSRIEEKKGLDILLNALGMVKIPFHLTIAGTGNGTYIDQLKSLAIQKNIHDNITWTGFVNDSKFELLQQHHLFVLPSHDENFGNTVIESLSVGIAVLISESVGLADYVEKNQLGWVCQPNQQSVREAIERITQQHTDLIRIRNSAGPIIRHDFNESRLVNQYLNMYQQIISA